jgi:hypothetical protein
MAGTMPHAIFVETDVDGAGLVAAYAAELPGCAVFAATDADATGAIPGRVSGFTAWLRQNGEAAPQFVGDNWYEVERAAATVQDGGRRRAGFSLDELPPSDAEFAQYLRWLELAREELASALDQAAGGGSGVSLIGEVERQDVAFTRALGGSAPEIADDPIDRLYAARDALTDALVAAGPTADGVRRVLRIAIADDLRAADVLRAG